MVIGGRTWVPFFVYERAISTIVAFSSFALHVPGFSWIYA